MFAEIARVKPSKLFVIADGPRDDHPEDAEKCAASRAIIERVDWECEVLKNCSERITSTIGITNEDSLFGNRKGFRFCQILLLLPILGLERTVLTQKWPTMFGLIFHTPR